MAERQLSLDACVLINLCATERISEIAAALATRFVVAREVSGETLGVRSGADPSQRSPIELGELVRTGVLEIVDLEGEEIATFVRVAERLDDGEAATLALAVHRGLALLTDDRAALRLIASEYAGLEVLSTARILRSYSEQAHLPVGQIAACLLAVEERASFFPARIDPDGDWWRTQRRASQGPDQVPPPTST